MYPAQFLSVLSSPAADAAPLTVREALSGISSTISLVSWIVLLVPQILENYKNQSGDGISMAFLLIWLFGDVANLAGSIESNLLFTVVILAVYFCLADVIIIGQTLYYKHINKRKSAVREVRRQSRASNVEDPTQPLLSRRRSSGANSHNRTHSFVRNDADLPAIPEKKISTMTAVAKNVVSILAVVLVGCLGWFLAWKSGAWSVTVEDRKNEQKMPWIGACLGYTSALLYLGARIPQILKNYHNKSCDGLSILFFLLSLLGNITYGAGILFHSTDGEYVLHNLPWLIGSLGTMAQDFIIFVQFHYYGKEEESEIEDGSAIV